MNRRKYVIAVTDPTFIRGVAPELRNVNKIYVRDYALILPDGDKTGTIARALASLPLGHAYNFLAEEGIVEKQEYTLDPKEAMFFLDDPNSRFNSGFFVEFMMRSIKHPPSFSIEELVD